MQAKAMIDRPAGDDGSFLETAHSRSCFPRIENFCRRAPHRIDEPTGQRSYARESLEKIQGGALGGE
jgi:hypothetical protein